MKTMASPTWSTLLEDLLAMILTKLDLSDHLRFSSVCKSWRSVATESNTAITKPFSLISSDDPHRLIRSLLSSFCTSWTYANFLGSFEGWLVLQLDYNRIILLNPSSKQAPIPLPPIPGRYLGLDTRIKKVVLSSSPESPQCSVVLKNYQGVLSFCRPGDATWNVLYNPVDELSKVIYMVFCEDTLYTTNSHGALKVFDSAMNSYPKHYPKYHQIPRYAYLVNESERLFVIEIEWTNIRKNYTVDVVTKQFKVFEVYPRRNSDYIEVESIGDNIFFLSSYCSLYLPAKDHPEFTPNHVYILSNVEFGVLYSFSLENRSHGRVICVEDSPLFFTLFSQHVSFRRLRA